MKIIKAKNLFLFSTILLFMLGTEDIFAQAVDSRCKFSEYAPIRINFFPEGTIVKQVMPNYPEKAKMQNIEDSVSVKLLINENGIVEKACAFYGNEIFWSEAEKAASKWRFKPKYGLAFSVKRKDNFKKKYAFAYIFFKFKLPEELLSSM